MKKSLLLFIGIQLVITINAQPYQLLQPSKRTIIAGKFNDIPKSRQIVELSGRNVFGETILCEFIDQGNGTFKFSIDLNLAQEFTLKSKNLIRLFLTPGDSLFIEFTKRFDIAKDKELNKHIKFSGNGARLNLDLLDYNCREQITFDKIDCEKESPKQFLEMVYNRQKKAEMSLVEYIEKYKPSQEFIEFQKLVTKYTYSSDMVYYKYCLFTKGLSTECDIYDKKLFPVTIDTALYTANYAYHLHHYILYNYVRAKKALELREKNDYYGIYKFVLDSINTTEEQGLSKDFMLFMEMNSCIEEDNDAFVRLSADYKKLSTNPILNAKIDSLVAIAQTPITNPNVYARKDGIINDSVDIFSEIGKQFKGKLVYVDIWATWCNPCRAEMPASLKMRDYFAGKDVAFVYICIESTKANWEKVIKDMKIEGNHFLLDKAQSTMFRKKIATNGVPHFLLIDMDGTLINANATRPSEDKTYKAIEELLKKR